MRQPPPGIHERGEWIGWAEEGPVQGPAMRKAQAVPSEVHEPVHWFDPSRVLATKEKLVITAIDEVYPELQLVNRLSATRRAARLRPGAREAGQQDLGELPTEALGEIAEVLRRYGF